jgi:hypothetical protein
LSEFLIEKGPNVCFWHKDIARLSFNVRFWGKADIVSRDQNACFFPKADTTRLLEKLQRINDGLNHAECERNANPCPGKHQLQRRGTSLPFVCV